jgi:hypothetical protein
MVRRALCAQQLKEGSEMEYDHVPRHVTASRWLDQVISRPTHARDTLDFKSTLHRMLAIFLA